MGLDLTSFDGALKTHYTDDRVENMVYQDNPLLGLMPKMENFGGRSLPIAIVYGNPQGRSASFTRAQARSTSTSSKVKYFDLKRVKDYAVATVDNETLEASKGDANAFMEAATLEIDGAINALTRSLAVALYGGGYGKIGVVGSVSGATVTLATTPDVTNFEIDMELVVSASESSNTLRALGTSGNGLIVTGVDRAGGVLTFGYNVTDATNGVPALVAGDVIFVRGDRDDSATPARLKVSGLEAWVPASTPNSTTFFSVDRSVDATRLGGMRLDGTNVPIEEALIEGASRVAREGFAIDHYFMNYQSYSSLEKALGSKVQYVDLQATAQVAFRGIQINGTRGPIKVVPDQNCPSNRVFGLSMKYWKVYSLGKAVRVIDTDGLQMIRQQSSDGIEVRYGYYANVGCRAPGANINIQV